MDQRRRAEGLLDREIRGRESGVNVALGNYHRLATKEISALVNLRSVASERLFHVQHKRQLLVIDVDK